MEKGSAASRTEKKNSRGAESLDCSHIYLLEFFFRSERAEPASVFAVLLLGPFRPAGGASGTSQKKREEGM